MSIFDCNLDSFKIRISSKSSRIRALLRNNIKPTAKLRSKFETKAYVSVIFSGFRRGLGQTSSPTFGSRLFGNTNLPSISVNPMRCVGSIRTNTTLTTIKRPPNALPNNLVNQQSQEFKDLGWDSVEESVYIPLTAINSTQVNSLGPQCIYAIKPIRYDVNFKFRASLSRPINNFNCRISANGKIKSSFEKLHGFFDQINRSNFTPTEKLFPIRDIISGNNEVRLVNEKLNPSGLFESINEGVAVGNITKDKQVGYLISDNEQTFITPSSIYTKVKFQFKTEVTAPTITPLETFLFMRAQAPIFNYESDIPPEYTISNIKFEDPSGNLIAKYKDFNIKGESNYEDKVQTKFVTYITEPETNLAALNTWKERYPILGEPSGYTLSFDVEGECFYDAFSPEFTIGFENECNLDDKFVPSSKNDYLSIDGSPISTKTQGYNLRPTNALRISAIELQNRGRGNGLIRDAEFPLFLDVVERGTLLERIISPTKVLLSTSDNSIYPTGTINLWKTSADIDGNRYSNDVEDPRSQFELVDRLSNRYTKGHITLDYTYPIANSGKLQLLYEHERPFSVKAQRGGSFSFGNKYLNQFSTSALEIVFADDSFFIVEEVLLRVEAKKAEGSPDFALDVVGYSDDGVLTITSQIGGFLQNTAGGIGVVPNVSGFFGINDLGISSESLSDKKNYFSKPLADNDGGDHYLLTQTPVINSTSFKTYDIPLKIYRDKVRLGQSRDYSMSTYFEALYLDIYPIPSGAEVAKADIIVKYKPAGALTLSTLGYFERELAKRGAVLRPSPRKIVDNPLNVNNSPLSLIERIPHAYESFEPTLKTNYSRRWRGSGGNIFAGPFDPSAFSFAFANPQLDQPFLLGYYDFNITDGNSIFSSLDTSSANIVAQYSDNLASNTIRNIGLRFNSNSIFVDQERQYKTLDWATSGHELYGKIFDGFDNAVKLQSHNAYIDFGNTPTSSGFAIYGRIIPDISISGHNYNLFNSGVIFSKWDADKDLEYAVAYSGGYLCGYALDHNANLIHIADNTPYHDYQYPLSFVMTYNDNNSRQLKLYTNNEIFNGRWNTLRDSSAEFILSSGNSNLILGHCFGSGVGFNGYVTECGISNFHPSGGGNLTNIAAPNASAQQENIDIFFKGQTIKFWNQNENHQNDTYSMWDFVNEPTSSWNLGSFKYCEFNKAFDIMKARVGKDYIYHSFYNTAQPYTELCDIALPDSVPHQGIAYHTQIENDMLRINLDGREDRFYSILPRIVKNFPRGYSIKDNALVVNTVVQHECDNDIMWPDGSVGAKLIVSLYTPSKENVLLPTRNFGLINRSTHYLNPKDCWKKIQSKLSLEDIKDRSSEPWAYFERSVTKEELEENYFSQHIDQMFIQYDLVYPTGDYTYSKIKIHSLDVSIEDALLSSATIEDSLPIISSGYPYRESTVSMYSTSIATDFNSEIYLYSSGVSFTPIDTDINLYTSGIFQDSEYVPFYSITFGNASTNNQNFGSYLFGNSLNQIGLNLNIEGSYDRSESKMNMIISTIDPDIITLSESLNLYSHFELNKPVDNQITLFNLAGFPLSAFEIRAFSDVNLYTFTPPKSFVNVNTVLNFYSNARLPQETIFDSMNLYLLHYKPIAKVDDSSLESFRWNGNNFGFSIDVDDNRFASIPANDEIRGVQTICYGSCDTGAFIKCEELPVITHDTEWFTPTCLNGGVARALTTYTNPNVGAFGTNIPYSGNFYGMRKFTNLIPQAPYSVVLTGKTASSDIIDVPREMSEWEYGTNEDVAYSGLQILPPSSSLRDQLNFGKDVSMLGDMLAIGCPNEYILDENNDPVIDAGKIYVYRRNPEPSGYDWSNQPDKSGWSLEQELTLPKGWKRDYFFNTSVRFTGSDGKPLPFTGTVRNWLVSQEGRELGYSLDSAKRNNTEVIVAGGPGAKWTRTFDPIQTTPVSIGLFVFNNELVTNPPNKDWRAILDKLIDRDILYRYFCDPPVKFDIKVILCEPMLGSDISFESSEDFAFPQPDFVYKYLTHRHFSYKFNSDAYKEREEVILQELKDIFHEVFPLRSDAIHSGIPPLLGFYIDNSRSLGVNAIGYGSNLRKGALDKFIDYYKAFSIASGLQDFTGDPAQGFANVTVDIDEDWIAQSINCLLDLTDIPTLQTNNTFRLFANNLGTFNTNAQEFNNPPPSGGAVYVFEKEPNETFRITQEIRSPITYTNDASDRFGHDVAISDDGKVLIVGSPYSEHAVQIYQYDEFYNDNLRTSIIGSTFINFLREQSDAEIADASFGEFYRLYREYEQKLPISQSVAQLKEFIFNKASDAVRYTYYKAFNIYPYYLIKELKNNDFLADNGGAWSTFFNNYIPTPRLGYSVDINEDGTLVAIGSPTDSLGERDSTQTWFRYDRRFGQSTEFGGENWQWQNYTNAGCVRLLESRNYYPHTNKVVEYYKFGNLHEALSRPEDRIYFNQTFAQLFESRGFDFSRTSFAEDKKIPQDAGLAFIITPAINAASEEIIANIKEWLSLGDRHLVIVGNDPKWEANGAYKQSNEIVNYLLERLEIKLRIYAARNEYEALMADTNTYYNVNRSFVPAKTTFPIGISVPLRGYGVGDIRLYDPGKSDLYSCDKPPPPASDPFSLIGFGKKKTYRELNDLCEMPIVHEGDLRAKYIDQCVYISPRGFAFLNYERNLAFLYGSHSTGNWGCNDGPGAVNSTPNERENSEPIPMLAAYEAIEKEIVVRAVPEQQGVRKVQTGFDTTSSIILDFGTTPYSGVDFVWAAENSNYTELNYNFNSIVSDSLFYDPEEYNGKDAVLQARASVPLQTIDKPINITSNFPVVAHSDYGTRGSKIVLIATTLLENRDVLLSSFGDENLNFYFNILARSQFGDSKVAQVGGFTGRTSYRDGYNKSDIQQQMTSLGIDMSSLNVPTEDLFNLSLGYDVAWIANTTNLPSDKDIENIKRFLDLGQKTLVITYGQNPNSERVISIKDPLSSYMIQAAEAAKYICEKLNAPMKPRFLPNKNKYASRIDSATDFGEHAGFIYINPNSFIYTGFLGSSFVKPVDFDSGEDGGGVIINVPPYDRFGRGTNFYHEIIPIDPNGATNGAYFDVPIQDLKPSIQGIPEFKTGVAKVIFDVPEPSGDQDPYNLFRLYFNYNAESDLEISPLQVYIANCSSSVSEQPNVGTGDPIEIKDMDKNGNIITNQIRAGFFEELKTRSSAISKLEANIQIPSGQQNLEIYITGFKDYELQENPKSLRTNRLISISGVRIPMSPRVRIDREPVFENQVFTIPAVPERRYTISLDREISTDSAKYCISNNGICATDPPDGYGTPGKDIADGPVVMAQEVYHQGGYFNGYNKSRVTVISDPSIIQGRTILTEDGQRINQDLSWFLASLYPFTFFPEPTSGKQYPNVYKIISPERSSPSRLINAFPAQSGINNRFGKFTSNNLPVSKYADDEGSKKIIPNAGQDFVQQPFDSMLGLFQIDPGDIGKFRKLPEPPKKALGEYFANGGLVNGLNQQQFEELWYVTNFQTVEQYYGSTSKIRDIYNGETYADAGFLERMPPILRATGKDHLDLDVFYSGYPGDLFGYRVKIHKNKIYVGSPFTPYSTENIIKWDDIVANGMTYGQEVGFNGGAGAVYVIDKVGNVGDGRGAINNSTAETKGIPWKAVKKFRPSEISVGLQNISQAESQTVLGPNSYSQQQLNDLAFIPDMFGYNFALNGDILAISAPGHNYETAFEQTSGEFVRKEFNEQFSIPKIIPHDLAKESERNIYLNSGEAVLNHGAVFTYENKIIDWGSKTQDWNQIHKLVAQGDNARIQNSGENTFFGQAIDIDRSRRVDGDYILAIGAKNHSLTNDNENYHKAGATYTYDGMLRKLRPSAADPESFIAGRVFGEYVKPRDYLSFMFKNGNIFDNQVVFNGVVFSTIDGEIFLEVSGQDKVPKGYVVHRPYIESINGAYFFGTPTDEDLRLFIAGEPPKASSNVNLFSYTDKANVYNTVGLYNKSALNSEAGINLIGSGKLPLYNTIDLFTSGVKITNSALNLETRGRY